MKPEKLIFIFSLMLLAACHRAPDYPDTPNITGLKAERFLRYDSQGTLAPFDSIMIHIDFQDGDGDLGRNSDYNPSPYHLYDFVLTPTGKYIEISDSDTLPPYSCKNYIEEQVGGDPEIDTVLIKRNPNHYNIFVDFLVKQPDGSFQEYDFTQHKNCTGNNGIFPPLDPENYSGPIEGTLSYNIRNDFPLEDQTIKFRVQIQDRALNKSNIVESEEILFTY